MPGSLRRCSDLCYKCSELAHTERSHDQSPPRPICKPSLRLSASRRNAAHFSALSLHARNNVVEMIMKTFTRTLVVVASLLLPFAASAQVQNAGPDGSTGGNSVGSALTSPGPSAGAGGATSGAAGAGASTQVQNAGPAGSTGANAVGSVQPAPSATGQSVGGTAHPDRTHQ